MLGRRFFLLSAMAVVPVFFWEKAALASTGIIALDTPSILVKDPSSVLLVAITRTPGNRLVAVGEHGVIIYSDDDGANWTQGNVPVNVTLTCIAFVTENAGWAAGHFGVILGTSDGGETWVVDLNGIQANRLAVQAAQNPSLATDPSPAAALAGKRAERFANEGPDKPFLTLLGPSPQKLIAFGAYRMTMITNDGGKTWQDWSLHIYDKLSHNIYGSARIGGDYYLVAEMGLVFCSKDGGNTFLPLSSPASVTLFGILGAKDGSLIVYGVAGSAFRSTNGGDTWNSLSIGGQQDLTGGRVLSSGSIILVDEAGLLFESLDNGVTFKDVSGILPTPFFDIQELPDGSLIAVGAAGITKIPQSCLAA
jgi:photosystem II stability/assembly factor-like uncharacterized protein